MSAVKRYQVFHRAMTTGMPLLRAMSDQASDAHRAAVSLTDNGEEDVQIVDSQSGKAYTLQTFAAEHKLR